MAGVARLTDEQWSEARRLFEREGWTARAIGAMMDYDAQLISKRARAYNWVALTADGRTKAKSISAPVYRAIREHADGIIAEEVARRTNDQLDHLVGQARQEAIEAAAAQEQARIGVLHRSGATRIREMMEGLLRELGVLSIKGEALLAFAEIVAMSRSSDDDDFDAADKKRKQAMQTFVDLLGLGNRADIAKKLVDSFAKVVDIERRVYGIKDDTSTGDALEALKLLAGHD